MESLETELVSYLQGIVTPLIDHPGSLKITPSIDTRGGVTLTIDAHIEDMGKIVGRAGETSNAIRFLLRKLGGRRRLYIAMVLNEPEGSTRPPYVPKPREDRPRY